jgi:hypothetical protein
MKKKVELDDIDVVFVDEPGTEEERKAFSAFLKQRKEQLKERKQLITYNSQSKTHSLVKEKTVVYKAKKK